MILFLMLGLVSKAQAVIDGSVINSVSELESPSVVGLVSFYGEGSAVNPGKDRADYCTGTLVARDVILTAAHCLGLRGKMAKKTVAFFSLNLLTPVKEQADYIVQAVPYPGTDFSKDRIANDLALLLLKHPAPANYQVAKILPLSLFPKIGTSVEVVGYGSSDRKTYDGSGILRRGRVDLQFAQTDQHKFVLDSREQGICSGDSGGPVYIQMQGQIYLLGVTSSSYEQDIWHSSNKTSIPQCSLASLHYTAGAFMSWIQSTVVFLEKNSALSARPKN
jgi:secreted trypsin-like serine protease